MEKPQLPLSGSLPLSGTQKLTGGPLRGKMAAEGKNRAHALTAEHGSLPLSGTQELTGDPLRGKMVAEGKKRLTHLPLSGSLPLSGNIFGLGPNFL
ncbi:hypothetical protein LR48_Vigan294s001000 [Vigna angularis]|uniref:Uncharacterized protein n=1 Tax=Phaseolus angularis TaxID=3914 RepID=A0A0L9T8Z9_PHAAN|nr:hypothetical protein LR48_Vigan294s001000 [Vigna angularis]